MKLFFVLFLIFIIPPLFFYKTIYANNGVEDSTPTLDESSTVINIVTKNIDKSFSYFVENTTSDLKEFYFSKVFLVNKNWLGKSLEKLKEEKIKISLINYFNDLYTNFLSKF